MRTPALVLIALALTAGCGTSGKGSSFSQPPVSSFQVGPCRTTAPATLRIGRDARNLGKGRTIPEDIRAHLKADQDLLVAAQPDFDPTAKPAIDAFVIEIGLVRLRADTSGYEPALGAALSKAYDAAVQSCTAPKATPTP